MANSTEMANKCSSSRIRYSLTVTKVNLLYYTVLHLFSIRLNKYYMPLIQWNISVDNNDLILISSTYSV